MPSNTFPSLLLTATLSVLGACAIAEEEGSPGIAAAEARRSLVGAWESTGEPHLVVTYHEDGSWESVIHFEMEGSKRDLRGRGTWKVDEDGVLLNTTISHDPIPGIEEIELPYLSRERLVSVDADTYRYVCPIQGCTNTMRRVTPR